MDIDDWYSRASKLERRIERDRERVAQGLPPNWTADGRSMHPDKCLVVAKKAADTRQRNLESPPEPEYHPDPLVISETPHVVRFFMKHLSRDIEVEPGQTVHEDEGDFHALLRWPRLYCGVWSREYPHPMITPPTISKGDWRPRKWTFNSDAILEAHPWLASHRRNEENERQMALREFSSLDNYERVLGPGVARQFDFDAMRKSGACDMNDVEKKMAAALNVDGSAANGIWGKETWERLDGNLFQIARESMDVEDIIERRAIEGVRDTPEYQEAMRLLQLARVKTKRQLEKERVEVP